MDDYVWVGLKGLIDLIDQMGGVDVVTSNPVLDDFYPADVEGPNPYSYKPVGTATHGQRWRSAVGWRAARQRPAESFGASSSSSEEGQSRASQPSSRSAHSGFPPLRDPAPRRGAPFNQSLAASMSDARAVTASIGTLPRGRRHPNGEGRGFSVAWL